MPDPEYSQATSKREYVGRHESPSIVFDLCKKCATTKSNYNFSWRGGRAVECDSLENCYTRKGIGGSNPSPSARSKKPRDKRGFCPGLIENPYSRDLAKSIAAGMSGSCVTSGTT